MGLKYVLNSMRRRKLRTLIIVLALTIGVALVGALLALVDTQRQFSIQTIGTQTGGYDISITKSDLAASTFFSIDEVKAVAAAAGESSTYMYARIQTSVEGMKAGNTDGSAVTVIAVDPATDNLITAASSTARAGVGVAGIRIGGVGVGGGGQRTTVRIGGGGGGGAPPGGGGAPPDGGRSGFSTNTTPGNGASIGATGTVTSTNGRQFSRNAALQNGAYPPAPGEIYLDSDTAGTLGVKVGDQVQLSYAVPAQREAGKAALSGTSTPRIQATFVVTGVTELSGVSSSVSDAIIMNLADAQAWLGQANQANQLLLVWDSSGGTTDARATVTTARDIGEQLRDTLQAKLGSEYTVSLPKYARLESTSASFTFTQIFITLYGILSMGIVGLMINALMTTTVLEQKFDLAVMRVIGSPRSGLFKIVIIEVVLLGVVGTILGLLLGRVVNDYLIVPILLANLNLPAGVRAAWTLQTVLTPTAITAVMLTLATISPARAAAGTKVMLVLNPSAADQPTLEDLSKLRERRADTGLLVAGLVLLAFSSVILILLPTVFTSGNFTGQTVMNYASLLLMVVGISLLFYFITTPFERVLVFLYSIIYPKAAYFAGRYSLRGKGRNALISLMVVMSGVLPCLLATQLALQDKNAETDSRFNIGAPLTAQIRPTFGDFTIFRRFVRQETNLTSDDVDAVKGQPGVDQVVGIAANLSEMTVGDRISLRTARVNLIGVQGNLNDVLYTDLYNFVEGNITSITRIASETNVCIISQGLSTALDLHVGDTLLTTGTGTDHKIELTIIGVASRIPGFSNYFTRSSSDANNSGVLMNLDTYRELANDPSTGVVDPTASVLTKLLATVQPGVNQTALLKALRNYVGTENNMNVVATSEQVTQARALLSQSRVFIVLLTALSMVTAVFGVLAVMYTAVMSRRVEIGMLKAIGSSKGALRGVFIGEAVITTVAAGISGIIAGTILGYVFYLSQRLQSDQVTKLAFDFNTAGIIIGMVFVAAVFSAAMAIQPVIRQKAIVILRER